MTQGKGESSSSWITAEMRSIIGRRFNTASSFPISRSDIRRWAISVYYPELPPAIYWDESAAAAGPYGGIVAPEDFNPFAWASEEPGITTRQATLDGDYLERQLGIEGPGLPTSLNGGMATTYGARMRPDDVISASSEIVDYAEKSGRMGRILITIVRTTWANQRDLMVKQTDQTAIRY